MARSQQKGATRSSREFEEVMIFKQQVLVAAAVASSGGDFSSTWMDCRLSRQAFVTVKFGSYGIFAYSLCDDGWSTKCIGIRP